MATPKLVKGNVRGIINSGGKAASKCKGRKSNKKRRGK
jgi:hypothetical protein